MSYIERLGDSIEVRIQADINGYLGRECPECERYFKVTPGTGLTGEGLLCVCPYCGHSGSPDTYFTQAQVEHAQSVAMNRLTGALLKDLKKFEHEMRPRGAFGVGLSIKVTGRPEPIRHYDEKALETELVCEACTLKYAIYGLFAFCPDCGAHNSRQILENNLLLAQKLLELAPTVDVELREHIRGDALENIVSAFDGFGRKICQVTSSRSTNPARAGKVHFQNLRRAQEDVERLYSYDLSSAVSVEEWTVAFRAFQKRHLLAHTMGLVDEDYVRTTGDRSITVGRKVVITSGEVTELLGIVRRLALGVERALFRRPP